MPIIKRKPLFKLVLLSLILLAFIRPVSTALAAFIGPNRTVTQTVEEGEGWGRECQLTGSGYRWVTTDTCNGCSASCANMLERQYPDSNPGSICNAAHLGSKVHDYSCESVEREITYQPAEISAAVACASQEVEGLKPHSSRQPVRA